jgi:hypothetical protein
MDQLETFHTLCFYTLSHGSPEFIHQHVVDAYTAQAAGPDVKPIAIFFALAGLYLHLERGYSGKEVQQAHLLMARLTKTYVSIQLPEYRGSITAADVLQASPGNERDSMIREWCKTVWQAFASEQEKVRQLTDALLSKNK